MLTSIIQFLRHHVIASLIAAVGIGAGGMWSIYEARVNRVEEMKVQALQSIADENTKFRVLLDQFTFQLAKENIVDPKIQSEMSSALVSLYSMYGNYRSNLPADDFEKMSRLQASINNVKKHIQAASKKTDLEGVGTALTEMFRAQKSVDSALESSVGRGGLNS